MSNLKDYNRFVISFRSQALRSRHMMMMVNYSNFILKENENCLVLSYRLEFDQPDGQKPGPSRASVKIIEGSDESLSEPSDTAKAGGFLDQSLDQKINYENMNDLYVRRRIIFEYN